MDSSDYSSSSYSSSDSSSSYSSSSSSYSSSDSSSSDSDSSASSTIREKGSNKRQKPNHAVKDMITSKLDDFIIGHILSFLPTKDAVRTSVLSRKWKYLWTFITKLEIADREPCCRKRIRKIHFQNFFYRVLDHLNASAIQSFSLSLSDSYARCHVNNWIFNILNRRIKELYVDSRGKVNISLDPLLKSQSLEVLVLKNGCAVRVPTFVSLSSLTYLKFSGITFTCAISNDSQNMTLNFPVLRKYETKNCSWLDTKGVSLTFEVPLLEVLLISRNLVSTLDESHNVMKFCAPRLTEFVYRGYISDTILFDIDLSTTHIASATIDPGRFEEEQTPYHFCELLKQFNNNVTCLKFERLKVLTPVQDDLPAFGMLSSLELGKVTGKILLHLLRNTPILKTLIFKELLQFDEELSNSDNVPCCFISNLEVVNFGRLNGDEHELRFAKFVIENGKVLKRASFIPTPDLLRQRRSDFEQVREKIYSFKSGVTFKLLILEFLSY